MQCPLCVDEVLDTRHRSGIEIDVCPRCRGVWLDRDELDKLAGSMTDVPPPPSAAAVDDDDDDSDDDDDDDDDRYRPRRESRRRRRLGEWLEDVLDDIFD